jgi:hypothetical protein
VAVGHAPNLGANPIHFLWQLRHNTENSLLFSLLAGNFKWRRVRDGLRSQPNFNAAMKALNSGYGHLAK